MAPKRAIAYVHDLASEIAQQNALMRELVARSIEALKLPKPDSFLGRKTQEPFPREPKDKGPHEQRPHQR